MVQYITTPWRSRASLLQVRDALYPSAPSTTLSQEEIASRRREAISRVSIWAQRGNCPHLVESTALLSAAILNDDPRNEAWCVRAAYASSFSRYGKRTFTIYQDSFLSLFIIPSLSMFLFFSFLSFSGDISEN
jgi:ribosomal biogenesis protein LAS1